MSEPVTVGYMFSPGIVSGALPAVIVKKVKISLAVGCFNILYAVVVVAVHVKEKGLLSFFLNPTY